MIFSLAIGNEARILFSSIKETVLGFNAPRLPENGLNGFHECSRLRAWHSDCTNTALAVTCV